MPRPRQFDPEDVVVGKTDPGRSVLETIVESAFADLG
jgi:hypothetical protein